MELSQMLVSTATAFDAAEHFAATAWSTPRRIGQWLNGQILRFQLVGGWKWYHVLPVDGGWEIRPADRH